MKKYEMLEMKVVFFFEQDIITNSTSETADDFGSWNDEWFAQWNS